jgi:hypothetical protein
MPATNTPAPSGAAASLRAYPNPFRIWTTVELDRPIGEGTGVSVYDVAGRRVVDLTTAVVPESSVFQWTALTVPADPSPPVFTS